jgi:hypothetical protein
MLLYRLLSGYPPDRVSVIEAGISASQMNRRLRSVEYMDSLLPLSRLQTTRVAPLYTLACLRLAEARAHLLKRYAEQFRAEAILTVTHGCSWITAATLARTLTLPLHLICHDEWVGVAGGGLRSHEWRNTVFCRIYQAAASRMCVSPFMAKAYESRFRVGASVLYPSRAKDCHSFFSPPERLKESGSRLTVAFAGTINSLGIVASLKLLRSCLKRLGGKVLLYGPMSEIEAEEIGLAGPEVQICGLIPSEQLIGALRRNVDALIVPMSFLPQDRANMEISFPSKLTDYTSAGLPLLIYGPEYCSAIQWGKDNPGVAELVVQEGETKLMEALQRLQSDPQHRLALAKNAIAIGRRYFSYGTAFNTLCAALNGAIPTPPLAQAELA